MSIVASPRRLPRVEDGPLAPTFTFQAYEDWTEIETLMTAPVSAPMVETARARSSRLAPLLLGAAFVAVAGAAAVPAAFGVFQGGGRADVPTIAAQQPPEAQQAARDVAGADPSPGLVEGRSAAEAQDQAGPTPVPRRRHRHHVVR